jgi:hypothetical protein
MDMDMACGLVPGLGLFNQLPVLQPCHILSCLDLFVSSLALSPLGITLYDDLFSCLLWFQITFL